MRDPTENGAAQMESVSPFAPKKGKGSDNADQLDTAGQSLPPSPFTKQPTWLKKTAGMRSIWRRRFHTSFVQLRIAVRN